MEVIIQSPGTPRKERRKLWCHKLLHVGKLLYLPWVPLILLISRVMLLSQMCLLPGAQHQLTDWGEVFLSFILNFILNREFGGNPWNAGSWIIKTLHYAYILTMYKSAFTGCNYITFSL